METKVNNILNDLKVNDIVTVTNETSDNSIMGIVVSIDESGNYFTINSFSNQTNETVFVENTEINTFGECNVEKLVVMCNEFIDELKSIIGHITTNKSGIHIFGCAEFKKYDVGIEISQFYQLLNLYSFKYKNNETEYTKALLKVMHNILTRINNAVDDSIADLEKKLSIV